MILNLDLLATVQGVLDLMHQPGPPRGLRVGWKGDSHRWRWRIDMSVDAGDFVEGRLQLIPVGEVGVLQTRSRREHQ